MVFPNFRQHVEGYKPEELVVYNRYSVRTKGWWSGRTGDKFIPEDFEPDPGLEDRVKKMLWKELGLPDMTTYYSNWIPT